MKITTNNVNWLTVESILPNPKVDSWAMTAIKIVGLVISLPVSFLMDLIKLAAARFQGKKGEAIEAPKPKLTWNDKARDLTNTVVSTVKSTPGNVYNFVANNKTKVIFGLGAVSALGAVIYYRTSVISFINSLLFSPAAAPAAAAPPRAPRSADDAKIALNIRAGDTAPKALPAAEQVVAQATPTPTQ